MSFIPSAEKVAMAHAELINRTGERRRCLPSHEELLEAQEYRMVAYLNELVIH